MNTTFRFNPRRLALLAAVALSTMNAFAADEGPKHLDGDHAGSHVVPIEHEPNHHVVLQTGMLRVFDVTFRPGDQSKWHSHSNDSLMITLDGANVPSLTPGVPFAKRPPIASGHIYYKGYGSAAFTHRITNVDDKAFRILDIEVLQPAKGLTLGALAPKWTNVLENERFRVSKASLAAGEKLPAGPFKGERLYVALADATFKVGEHTVDVKRGTALPASGASAGEAITNLGGTFDMAIVEVK